MREYPKIETLYVRDERTKKVDPSQLRCPEFGIIGAWRVTEKIDGTNIRISLNENGGLVIGGRTDAAQVPTPLLGYLMETFTPEALRAKFADAPFVIFGEGYGPKIQNGGDYSPAPRLRVFDVLVGDWWLEPENVEDVAATFNVRTVPTVTWITRLPRSRDDLASLLPQSWVPNEDGGKPRQAEGIVARPVPLLLNRRGERLLWKLKFRDF